MFRDRGVFEIPAVGMSRRYQARTAKGHIAFELTVSLSSVSPEAEGMLVERMKKWLDQIDPQLRVLPGGSDAR